MGRADPTPVSMFLAGAAGLLTGSFLSAVVERVPERRSVVSGRSRCCSCGTVLAPRELVPVLSWLVQRGRCRVCRAPIGCTPLMLEIGCGAISVAVVHRFGVAGEGIAVWVGAMALVALSIIDVRTHRLPREISYLTFVLVVASFVFESRRVNDGARLVDALLGAAVFTAALAVVRVASRGGLGDGDVRLAPLLGVLLGWWGVSLVPVAIVAASTVGALVGLVGMACGRLDRRTPLPFGPFLAAATMATLVVATGS